MNKKALETGLQFVGQGGSFSLLWITSSALWGLRFLDPSKISYRSWVWAQAQAWEDIEERTSGCQIENPPCWTVEWMMGEGTLQPWSLTLHPRQRMSCRFSPSAHCLFVKRHNGGERQTGLGQVAGWILVGSSLCQDSTSLCEGRRAGWWVDKYKLTVGRMWKYCQEKSCLLKCVSYNFHLTIGLRQMGGVDLA